MSPAVLSIIILVVCVVLFVTEWLPLITTAVLGATAMAVFGILTFSQAFGGFASDTVFLVVGMVTLGNAMFATGAAQLLGKAIIKVAGNNERVILAISMTAAAAISAFLSNTATVAMFMAIFTGLTATNRDLKYKNLVMPVALAAVAGGVCTLVGSTPQVVAQGLLINSLGKGFEFFDFAWVGVPICVVMVLFFVTIGYNVGKKIWGDRYDEGMAEVPVSEETEEKKPEVNNTKVIISLVIFVLTITAFVTKVFDAIGLTCMVAALLCVITRCISQKEAIEQMDWVSVGVLGGALGLAEGLAVSGGGKMIADAFINLVGIDASAFVIFAAIMFITVVLTQFMSNTASVAMLVPISIFICQDMGYNPYAFAMGIIVAANMSFSTPVATTPLTMTLKAGYRFMDYVKMGGVFNIIAYFLVIILTPISFPLLL
ncbi:MAG: SLC13 family permease [Syntrophomonadaceae bacterium]|jgi:anion transporter|nr:SLC13 family permease [Syntrophomonadaceae bacterium]